MYDLREGVHEGQRLGFLRREEDITGASQSRGTNQHNAIQGSA
jgi:hypothetical protein